MRADVSWPARSSYLRAGASSRAWPLSYDRGPSLAHGAVPYPMRILAVIHYPVFGGPSNRFGRLTDPLRTRGVDTYAIVPTEPGNVAERLRAFGTPVIEMQLHRVRDPREIRANATFLTSFRSDVRRIRGLLRELRPDLLIIPGLPNAQSAIAARLEGVPVVWQIVDSRAPGILIVACMPAVRRLADAVMFWGGPVRDQHLRGRPLSQPIFLAHSAVDIDAFKPDVDRRRAFRAQSGVPDDAPLVGLVGNLNPQKGIETFIATARQLADRFRSAHFVHVGAKYGTHEQYTRDMEAAAAHISGGRFHFAGPRSDIENVYPALDVQMVTSVPKSEGIPTVALEGMACGVPIVATDAGSTRDVVTDAETGFVLPPGDVAGLTAAVARLIESPSLREEFGERARARAVREFGVDPVSDLHLEVFAAAAAHAAARRRD